MRTIQIVKPASAYLEGMIWAAFGVRIFGYNASEWQIDGVSRYAKKLKEEEIEHSSLTLEEKENQKRLWKVRIEKTTGVRREGRMMGTMEI